MTSELPEVIDDMWTKKGKPSPKLVIVRRRESSLNAYVNDGMTLEEIGLRWGISRERVRQDLNAIDPTLYHLAHRRRVARTRLRKFVTAGSVKMVKVCKTCGQEFLADNGSYKFCSPVHNQVWMLLRYHLKDEVRAANRVSTAKILIRKNKGSQIWANNVLNDEVTARGRWLQQGSLNFHWAVRAHAMNWPIFDQLPPEIQQQVRDYATGASGEDALDR